MMRSLWSAASGMIAQQTNVDTIANNLANVNTTGYKGEKVEFKSLLYQTLQTRTTTANGEQKPISAQVGLGTRVASITSNFTQGPALASENDLAFAIQGEGFFALRGVDGETYYTRNGNFGFALDENQNLVLTNSNGNPIYDTNGQIIVLPKTVGDMEVTSSNVTVTGDGRFYLKDKDGNVTDLGIKLGLFQFNNPAGLEKLAGSMYRVTDASGEALNEDENEDLIPSEIMQGYLEGSNVQVADEMVSLIVAQRAYELNSKAIQATDEMLGQANNLKR